ncbi:hypothetical protein JXL21_05590 [Candidatus Bathyarchaeota archaeon]|nr:hypothetical protein [Candidatus Bathyarchaeota archaeon]
MVVEVDDSGWGDLVGGAVIVMRRVGTNEKHVGEIPLAMFREPDFKYKEYLRATTQIILEGIDALNVERNEPLHICTGYIFTSAKETLRELGYTVKEVKITGATQELAEREFIASLVRLGVGSRGETAEMRSFEGFLEWVHEDLGGRERFVKTGWKSWEKHRGRK